MRELAAAGQQDELRMSREESYETAAADHVSKLKEGL